MVDEFQLISILIEFDKYV